MFPISKRASNQKESFSEAKFNKLIDNKLEEILTKEEIQKIGKDRFKEISSSVVKSFVQVKSRKANKDAPKERVSKLSTFKPIPILDSKKTAIKSKFLGYARAIQHLLEPLETDYEGAIDDLIDICESPAFFGSIREISVSTSKKGCNSLEIDSFVEFTLGKDNIHTDKKATLAMMKTLHISIFNTLLRREIKKSGTKKFALNGLAEEIRTYNDQLGGPRLSWMNESIASGSVVGPMLNFAFDVRGSRLKQMNAADFKMYLKILTTTNTLEDELLYMLDGADPLLSQLELRFLQRVYGLTRGVEAQFVRDVEDRLVSGVGVGENLRKIITGSSRNDLAFVLGDEIRVHPLSKLELDSEYKSEVGRKIGEDITLGGAGCQIFLKCDWDSNVHFTSERRKAAHESYMSTLHDRQPTRTFGNAASKSQFIEVMLGNVILPTIEGNGPSEEASTMVILNRGEKERISQRFSKIADILLSGIEEDVVSKVNAGQDGEEEEEEEEEEVDAEEEEVDAEEEEVDAEEVDAEEDGEVEIEVAPTESFVRLFKYSTKKSLQQSHLKVIYIIRYKSDHFIPPPLPYLESCSSQSFAALK